MYIDVDCKKRKKKSAIFRCLVKVSDQEAPLFLSQKKKRKEEMKKKERERTVAGTVHFRITSFFLFEAVYPYFR